MIRKHAAPALLAAAALQASLAYGLGLGDITLHSSLNERLDADIRLRGIGDLNPAQILIRLGSGIDFDRAGVERLQYLSDLRFEVRLDGSGGGIVHVTTNRPVSEPYMDFIVEARWPNGRVLREYTVLLDLPVYTNAGATSAAPPMRRREPIVRSSDDGGLASGSGEYRVRSGDTLWRIASHSRPSGVSVQQMMNAIQRDNPRAFIGGDMNRMLAGVVLRLPQGSDIDRLSGTSAPTAPAPSAQPVEQAAPSLTPVESAAVAAQSVEEDTANDAYLAIAGDSGAPVGEQAAGGESIAADSSSSTEATSEQLTAAQESLLAAERANAELQTRVTALEAQVADFQKISELEQQQHPEAAAPPVTAQEPGFLERVLQSTVTLVAVALALLAGMVAFLFRRRRSVSEFVPAPFEAPRVDSTRVEGGEAAHAGVARAAPVPAPVPVSVPHTPSGTAVAEGEDITDPLVEADVCLAYGHAERAESILRDALRTRGDDPEVRLKLMDVLASRHDESEFLRQYGALASDPKGRRAARDILEQHGLLNWIEEGPAAAAGLAAVTVEPALNREQPFDIDLAAELQQVADTLGGPADSGAQQRGVMLAKTEQAIARAAAELGFDAETLATTSIDTDSFGETGAAGDLELSLDLDEFAAGDKAEFDLPLGELELGGPSADVPAPTLDDDLAMLAGSDETATKLDLARAYLDMGDREGACDILEEVRSEGNEEQRAEAASLLERARTVQ